MSGFHLARPKADVLKELRKQLSKGRDIAEYEYDEDEVDDAINDESKWDLLNVEFLRRAFSDETILNEYKSIQLTKYYGDWEDRLGTHETRIRKRIAFLESVILRINKKLIPESGEGFEGAASLSSGEERVFVIHGHDEGSKSQVARLVEKLGWESASHSWSRLFCASTRS